jgi:hypothetical protein
MMPSPITVETMSCDKPCKQLCGGHDRKFFLNFRQTVDGKKIHKHQIASQKLAELTETFQRKTKENEALKSGP